METVQMTLRGVPVEVAETLRAQARAEGKSLNRYMIDRLTGDTERFRQQRELAEKYSLKNVTRAEIEETNRLREAMKDDWG